MASHQAAASVRFPQIRSAFDPFKNFYFRMQRLRQLRQSLRPRDGSLRLSAFEPRLRVSSLPPKHLGLGVPQRLQELRMQPDGRLEAVVRCEDGSMRVQRRLHGARLRLLRHRILRLSELPEVQLRRERLHEHSRLRRH